MQIGGIQKFSLIDYPGKISAVIFLLGCNFRCGFCHNPELVDPKLIKSEHQTTGSNVTEEEILGFLAVRQGKLDGVCITGGEPTIWRDLPEFIAKIRKLGFLVKLDTNGTDPETVKELIDKKLVDYFAIDIKNSPEKYGGTVNVSVKLADIENTLKAIATSGIPLELRTTVVPGLIIKEDFVKIKKWLEDLGVLEKASLYAIQQFRPLKTLNKDFQKINPYLDEELREMEKAFSDKVRVEVRGV